MDIADRLYEYIGRAFDVLDDPDYTKDVHLFDFGFVDSLGATNIISWLEETFAVEITQRDITLYPMNTVSEIADVVRRKLGA